MTDATASHWLPLESNPDVMTTYAKALGLPDGWMYTDIYGLDESLLAMTPTPVLACLLLFPMTPEQEEARAKHVDAGELDMSTDLFFCKQLIGNACGTLGILHSLAANDQNGTLALDKEKPLKAYLTAVASQSPTARGEALKNDTRIQACHTVAGNQGQSEVLEADADVNLHFITFVQHKGALYELDGGQKAPIRHQATSQETFLKDCAKVVQAFIDRDPDNVNFNLIALCAATEGDDS